MADKKILSIQDGLSGNLPNIKTAKAGRFLITTDSGEMYYEPEDGKRVKINKIDQTYSPESENAQSGKAVAEAVTPKLDKSEILTQKSDYMWEIMTERTMLDTTYYQVGTNSDGTYKILTGTHANFDTYVYKVNAGETYKVTSRRVNSSNYCLAIFSETEQPANNSSCNDNGFVYRGGDTQYFTDEEVTVPNGYNYMIITTYNNVAVTVKQYTNKPYNNYHIEPSKNYVSFDGTDCFVKAKYDNGNDIVFNFKKRGKNNLVDFSQIYLTENINEEISTDTTNATLLISNGTDFFSPHQIKSVNNADGDRTITWTGGNHNSDGVATARCVDFMVFCNNRRITDGSAYGDVVLKWTNMIQGQNTFKTDGTGREILKEEIKLHFNGSRIECEIKHTALEDLIRHVYYGLQALLTNYTNILYIGGNIRTPQTNLTTVDTNCGNKKCREIIAYNDNHTITMGIYDVDLGDFSHTNQPTRQYSAFTTTSNKMYFNVIDEPSSSDLNQNANEVTITRGFYDFKPNI